MNNSLTIIVKKLPINLTKSGNLVLKIFQKNLQAITHKVSNMKERIILIMSVFLDLVKKENFELDSLDVQNFQKMEKQNTHVIFVTKENI